MGERWEYYVVVSTRIGGCSGTDAKRNLLSAWTTYHTSMWGRSRAYTHPSTITRPHWHMHTQDTGQTHGSCRHRRRMKLHACDTIHRITHNQLMTMTTQSPLIYEFDRWHHNNPNWLQSVCIQIVSLSLSSPTTARSLTCDDYHTTTRGFHKCNAVLNKQRQGMVPVHTCSRCSCKLHRWSYVYFCTIRLWCKYQNLRISLYSIHSLT